MLTYQCTIPANTNATLYLPMEVDREDSFKVIKGVEYKGNEQQNGVMIGRYERNSGTFEFKSYNGILTVSTP
jgi:alpha-L-rhamnosidase